MRALATDPDEERWRGLMAEFGGRMRGYLRRSRCSPDEIEDLMADAWAIAVDHKAEFLWTADDWSVIRMCLRAVCRRRSHRLRGERRLRNAVSRTGVRAIDDDADRDTARSAVDWALDALSTLPAKERTAVAFRYLWAMPYLAIAAGIDSSEVGARKAVSRGLARLRQLAGGKADRGIDL